MALSWSRVRINSAQIARHFQHRQPLCHPSPQSLHCRSSRTYYSYHCPDPPPFTPVQTTILAAALERVPVHGFTANALTLGAKDAGYLEVSVQLFPRGAYDLINYHLVTQRLGLKDRVQFPDDSELGVGKKVRTLTLERLRANKNIIHQWQGVCTQPVKPSRFGLTRRSTGTWLYVSSRQYSSIAR